MVVYSFRKTGMLRRSINNLNPLHKVENTLMTDADIEAVERATVAAVSPEHVEEMAGWLLPMDQGTVSRAKSAVPLRHVAPHDGLVGQVEAVYRSRGLTPALRLADHPCFDGLRHELSRRGYHASVPVLVQCAPVAAVRSAFAAPPAGVSSTPDAGWAAVFLSEGFDPVDGAHRVKALSRATGSVYASVRHEGKVVAAGAGAFSHGWGSVHGMRTDQGFRGQGLAGRVLAGLAQVAAERGIPRLFLQVEEPNASARALYQRAGFVTAWRYAYWTPG